MFNEIKKKMNVVKSVFSIKDLENLSGIKAHTIRIWEKRYNILEPMRTDTNIRSYDLTNLQKLLNICLLIQHGYKISRISTFSNEKIAGMVNEISSEKNTKSHAISAFKIAMMNFDQTAFLKTYDELLNEKKFSTVFYDVFIPLLEELGLLWQTATISPAHEHFISHLIKQKLLINIEKLQRTNSEKSDRVFVLYLPSNEIHELGLLYLNYEILHNGYKTIFLGSSIPTECLLDVKKYFNNITFVTYITVEPNPEHVNDYIQTVNDTVLNDSDSKLYVLGRMTEFVDNHRLSEKTRVFQTIGELSKELKI
ncbi:transcriptional regulator, MerR family protein [Flavobacterium saliperosum S13]|uniref:B12 binding domain-containing protein n=3 Tax=Flavobacterium saliperosum TaxID=329186 RepID=A0A1G4V1Q3_9FLAO|nr:transcriptional regulator, MerR family protein [Flavobacterium saliperosum S13]SCW99787.1 B12 binding domain-containing protein [Flavobacterium saliperosum]